MVYTSCKYLLRCRHGVGPEDGELGSTKAGVFQISAMKTLKTEGFEDAGKGRNIRVMDYRTGRDDVN